MAELGTRTKGDVLEGIAFQFCKVATVTLIAGRWTLPLASLLCAGFFVAAYRNGKKDTRCALRHPLLAAAIFGVVGVAATWWNLRPAAVPEAQIAQRLGRIDHLSAR